MHAQCSLGKAAEPEPTAGTLTAAKAAPDSPGKRCESSSLEAASQPPAPQSRPCSLSLGESLRPPSQDR